MTIQVKQNLVAANKYNIKCPFAMDADYVTYHNTYNDATAAAEVSYMIGNNNEVSFHFAVDDIGVVQGVPVNRNTWNSGDGRGKGNMKSISVEVCYSKSGGPKFEAATKLANKFIAQLLYERGWGIDRVKKHQDWSGKYCPHRILDEGRWNQVLQDIQAELNILKGGSKPVAPTPTPTPPSTSYVGKRVEAKVDLNFYTKPTWNTAYKAGICQKGMGFTIVDKVSVDGAYQYKVKNSKGAIYYITASPTYVIVK